MIGEYLNLTNFTMSLACLSEVELVSPPASSCFILLKSASCEPTFFSDSDDDDADGQIRSDDDLIYRFLEVVDDTICDEEEEGVVLFAFFDR